MLRLCYFYMRLFAFAIVKVAVVCAQQADGQELRQSAKSVVRLYRDAYNQVT